MSVTLNSVRQLKEQLTIMTNLCDEMLSSRVHDKLFTSASEYEDAKVACKYLPEQYYLFRMFDCKIEIRYTSAGKEYYLYYDNCSPHRQFVEEYDLRLFHNSGSAYLIYGCKDLDKAVKVFQKAVISFIRETLGEELFYIF